MHSFVVALGTVPSSQSQSHELLTEGEGDLYGVSQLCCATAVVFELVLAAVRRVLLLSSFGRAASAAVGMANPAQVGLRFSAVVDSLAV